LDHAPGLGGTQNNPLSTTPAPNVFSRQGVGDLRGGKASLMPRHIQARGTQSRLLAGRFPSNRSALPKSVVVRCRRRSGWRFFLSKSDCRPGSLPGAGHTVTIIGWQIPIKQKRSSEERCCSMPSPIWGAFFFRRSTVALAASQRRDTQSRLLVGRFPSNRNALPKSVVVRCRRRSGGRFFFEERLSPWQLPRGGTHSHEYWLADSHQTETLFRRALLFDVVADLGAAFFRRATVALAASQGRDTQSRLLAGSLRATQSTTGLFWVRNADFHYNYIKDLEGLDPGS